MNVWQMYRGLADNFGWTPQEINELTMTQAHGLLYKALEGKTIRMPINELGRMKQRGI